VRHRHIRSSLAFEVKPLFNGQKSQSQGPEREEVSGLIRTRAKTRVNLAAEGESEHNVEFDFDYDFAFEFDDTAYSFPGQPTDAIKEARMVVTGGTSLVASPVVGQGRLSSTSSSNSSSNGSRLSQSQSSEDSSSSGEVESKSEGGGEVGESRKAESGHGDNKSRGQATAAAKTGARLKESKKNEEDRSGKGRMESTRRGTRRGEKAERKASARETAHTAGIEKKKMKAMRVFQAKMAEYRPKADPVEGSKFL
jgi:hypothetical protein